MEKRSSDDLIREAKFRLDEPAPPPVKAPTEEATRDGGDTPPLTAEAATPTRTFTAEAMRQPTPPVDGDYAPVREADGPSGPASLWRYSWVLGVLVVVGVGLYSIIDSTESVGDIGIGDCFDDPGGFEVSEVVTKGCDRPHDFEVFASIESPDGDSAPYPGGGALYDWSMEQCIPIFQAYTLEDYSVSSLWIWPMTPTAESWNNGDRETICVVFRSNDGFDVIPETGSVKAEGV